MCTHIYTHTYIHTYTLQTTMKRQSITEYKQPTSTVFRRAMRRQSTISTVFRAEYRDIIRIATSDEYGSLVDEINRLDPDLSTRQCIEVINAVFNDVRISVFENALACVMSPVLSPHLANHLVHTILRRMCIYNQHLPYAKDLVLELLRLCGKISISYIRDDGGKLNRKVLENVCLISKLYPRITNTLLQHEDYHLLRTEAFWCGTEHGYRKESMMGFCSKKGLAMSEFLVGHYIYQLGLYICGFDEFLFELAGWKMIGERHKNPSFAYALVEAKKTVPDVIVEVTKHSDMPKDICVMIAEYTVFTDRAQKEDERVHNIYG
jgi:hypothetical protein